MKWVSARLVPELLTADQMDHRVEVYLEIRVYNDSNFIKSIITSVETCVYEYVPDTEVQWSQWKTATSPRSKKEAVRSEPTLMMNLK